jgi:uncharacterized membrane protein YqaE (UPF0057 family)
VRKEKGIKNLLASSQITFFFFLLGLGPALETKCFAKTVLRHKQELLALNHTVAIYFNSQPEPSFYTPGARLVLSTWIDMSTRLLILTLNILFPPLAVLLLCGPGMDFMLNCVFFLLAIIPSHIHGMYISLTYFNRTRKVRNGKLPGKWRGAIYSKKVQNGGASDAELEQIASNRRSSAARKRS